MVSEVAKAKLVELLKTPSSSMTKDTQNLNPLKWTFHVVRGCLSSAFVKCYSEICIEFLFYFFFILGNVVCSKLTLTDWKMTAHPQTCILKEMRWLILILSLDSSFCWLVLWQTHMFDLCSLKKLNTSSVCIYCLYWRKYPVTGQRNYYFALL